MIWIVITRIQFGAKMTLTIQICFRLRCFKDLRGTGKVKSSYANFQLKIFNFWERENHKLIFIHEFIIRENYLEFIIALISILIILSNLHRFFYHKLIWNKFLYNPLDPSMNPAPHYLVQQPLCMIGIFFINPTEKVIDIIIVEQDEIELFDNIHYGWKIGTSCSKLGSYGQILINPVKSDFWV